MTTSTADRDTRSPSRPGGPDGDASPAPSGLESFRRYTYWSVVGVVVVLLPLPIIVGPVPHPPDVGGIISWIGVVVVLVTLLPLISARITPSPMRPPRSAVQQRWMIAVGGLAAATVAGTWLQAGDRQLWAFAPAMVASVAVAPLPPLRRRTAVVATVVGTVGAGVVVGAAIGVEELGLVAGSGTFATGSSLFLILASRWTWKVVVQLDEARRQAATLAVANERLRFAADLHDIQGHHLQVIALKSELAGRLVHDDPDTAQREITQVRQLAADALSDTRAVVQGYRRTSLDAEINNARTVLRSAGIDAQLHLAQDVDVAGLAEESRHVLGLVVREAVTNVLRHSKATRADIELERADGLRLTITNDGVTSQPSQADGGLRDLADRLHHAGGALRWERETDAFRVQATLAADGDA